MKEYVDLMMKIVLFEEEDIVTASIPGESAAEEDPYHGSNNWWN